MFRAIKGWEDLYLVSEEGTIVTVKGHKEVKQTVAKNRYMQVTLRRGRGSCHYNVHKLVAQAFANNFYQGCDIHHKDGNRFNNHLSNLACMTREEHNLIHNMK